jgi:hypothetical protein
MREKSSKSSRSIVGSSVHHRQLSLHDTGDLHGMDERRCVPAEKSMGWNRRLRDSTAPYSLRVRSCRMRVS